MKEYTVDNGPMLNAYPDSMGGTLSDIAEILSSPELKDTFGSFYILPSVFNSDLDRGFSIVNYDLNELMASKSDLKKLQENNIDLKLDFILNHISVLSEQFQDLIKNGEKSKYKDFFINWNTFWDGCGTMTPDGYIKPDDQYIKNMFFRKPGLPILMVRYPDGREVPYWNTFYQKVQYPDLTVEEWMKELNVQYSTAEYLVTILADAKKEGISLAAIDLKRCEKYKEQVLEVLAAKRTYLGQMDVSIKSPLVWDYYKSVLKQLSDYGAKIVRLDAFAYAPKEPGEKNFLNEPGTWDLLERVKELADPLDLMLLPEIHASYEEKIYETVADKGYMTYDFFLPGLMIDALERNSGDRLVKWANELMDKKIKTVNMLGCHDGIPLLDLKGMIPEEEIQSLMDTVVRRGGYIKNLHGQKNVYYQVNATYYSALGEDDKKLLLARAIQLFMPGKPQIWYLDLLAGCNDHEAVVRAGEGGHKEINRTNLTMEEVKRRLSMDVVKKQLEMISFRKNYPAFGFDAEFEADAENDKLTMSWSKDGYTATLKADLKEMSFEILTNK